MLDIGTETDTSIFRSSPASIQFVSGNQKVILTITPDGTFERGKDFPTDHAASVAFIECLRHCAMDITAPWRLRAEKAEAELAALKDTLSDFE